jgi:hypothetical protein
MQSKHRRLNIRPSSDAKILADHRHYDAPPRTAGVVPQGRHAFTGLA